MASFNGFILTNKGRELLAKAVAGEQLTFTKMEVGDGTFTGDIKTLTALVNKKDDFNINQIENQGNGQVILKAIINNQSTATGYYIREMGVFAHGADSVEILYAYNKAMEADYFPAFNSSNVVEVEYQNIIIVDQAQNVTAVIDPSLTYITKEEVSNTYVKKTQIATETNAGITTIEEMWKQDSNIIGGEFGGKFPVTNIEVGKVYYYFDSARNIHVPYTALKTATGIFNAPNADNFKESTFKGFLTQRKILLNTPVEIFILPRDGIEKNAEVTAGHDYKFAEAIVRVYKAGTFDHRITLHAPKGGVFRQEDSALTSSGSAITNFGKSKYRLNMYPFADKVYFDGVHYATGDSSNVVITLELLTIYN